MFDNIEYFESILKHGSLSKAAAATGVSQPAFSNYLKQLEAKAGATLFDRSCSPVILTDAGKVYYKYLKQAQAIKNDFLAEIGDLGERKGGTVTIGGASSTTACYLPRVTSEFLARNPENSVRIVDGVVSDIARRTLNGEIDFFITPDCVFNDEFEYIKLLDERIFMCVPECLVKEISATDKHSADELKRRRIPIKEFTDGTSSMKEYDAVDANIFKDSRFILLEEGTNIREFSNQFFEKKGYTPKNPVEVSQMLTGFQLCQSGAGITFLTESILRFGNYRECPAIYAVDGELSHREMYVCRKKSRYVTASCSEFIEMLKKMMA